MGYPLTYGVNPPVTIEVVVTGGIGTTGCTINGKGINVAILPPSESATFDLDIRDGDGFLKVLAQGVTGLTTIENIVRYWEFHNVTILNATDGTYKVKIWLE